MDINKLIINGNTETEISKNIFIAGGKNSIYIENNSEIDYSLRFNKNFNDMIFKDPYLVKNSTDRTSLLNKKIEQLIYLSTKHKVKPIIRSYGYFTSFSSIRQKSESTDIAKLELIEKNNLIKMAKLGYKIKAIVALNIEQICKLGYSEEQCIARCNDLYLTIRELDDYQNVEIIFDNQTSLNSLWIIDSLIKVESLKIDVNPKLLNYNSTIFDSDINSVSMSINSFDSLFEKLKFNNHKKYDRGLKESDYVKEVTKSRISENFKNKEGF